MDAWDWLPHFERLKSDEWVGCERMYETSLRDVLPLYSYHPLHRRVTSVLLHAQRCAHVCSDVRGYIPFGVASEEPDTSDS